MPMKTTVSKHERLRKKTNGNLSFDTQIEAYLLVILKIELTSLH